VEAGDPDRFLAAMAAPPTVRGGLFVLYALNLEIAKAPFITQEPMIAEMRLQWWRDALEEIRNGGPVRRHEVVTPLALVLDAQAATDLDTLVEARRADIEGTQPDDFGQILRYVDATAGGLLWTAARLVGTGAEGPVRAAGRAQGLAAYLSAVPDLTARGRHPLPQGDKFAAMRALAEMGLTALAQARKDRPKGQKRAVMSVMAGVDHVLRRVQADPQAALDGPVTQGVFRNALGFSITALTGRF
ncbi:MAG: squalene/phytoene synthase family protein, partial [Pseudomonadota bacterium]